MPFLLLTAEIFIILSYAKLWNMDSHFWTEMDAFITNYSCLPWLKRWMLTQRYSVQVPTRARKNLADLPLTTASPHASVMGTWHKATLVMALV